MTITARSLLSLLLLLLAALPATAQEEPVDPETLPDGVELLHGADGLFADQEIEALSARLIAYRDPHGEISLEDLRADAIDLRGRIPLQGRYEYWAPNHFNFFVLGLLLATSEKGTGLVGAITAPLLPMPGGIIASERNLAEYRVRTSGTQVIGEGDWAEECWVVRLHPHKPKEAFYKSLTYYISVADPRLMRGVRATFDDGGRFVGTGWGTFYYKDHDGVQLPFVGEGEVHFKDPDRVLVLKGKWRDFKTNEDASVDPAAIEKSTLSPDTDVPL